MEKNEKELFVKSIREKYEKKSVDEYDEIKKLDNKVSLPAYIFAYSFGLIGALIMGLGMSLVMTNFGTFIVLSNSMPFGIVLGIVGIIIVCLNYPLFKLILNKRRQKYAEKIITLSESLLK